MPKSGMKPISTESLAAFIGCMKETFDGELTSAVDTNAYTRRSTLDVQKIRVDCNFLNNFTTNSFLENDLWPWTADSDANNNAHDSKDRNNLHATMNEFGNSLGKKYQMVSTFDSLDEGSWQWCSKGRAPMAWAYFFGSIYRIFCQEQGFKTIRSHSNSFEWLLDCIVFYASYQITTVENVGHLPIFQASLIKFINSIIETDSRVTIELLKKNKFLSMIQQEMFLKGGVNEINSNLKQYFKFSQVTSSVTNRIEYTYSGGIDPDGIFCGSWLILHDQVLEMLMNCLKCSFKIMDEEFATECFYAVSSTISGEKTTTGDDHELSNQNQNTIITTPSDTVICACVRWLNCAIDSFHWHNDKEIFKNTVSSLLNLSNKYIFKSTGNENLFYTDSDSMMKSVRHSNEINSSLFMIPARYLAIEFLLSVTRGGSIPRLVKLIKPVDQAIELKFDSSNKNWIIDELKLKKKTLNEGLDASDFEYSNQITDGNKNEETLYLHQFLYLLLDSKLKEVGMHLIFRIVYGCCSKIIELESKMETDDGKKLIENSIPKEIMHQLFRILGKMIKNNSFYPRRVDFFRTMKYILRCLTWMLRSPGLLEHQHILQDCMSKANIIPSVYEGLYISRKEIGSRTDLEDLPPMIYKQAISFITALMMDHDKNMVQFEKQVRSSSDVQAGAINQKFNAIILAYETVPSLETAIVLFEMMLGATFNNRLHNLLDNPEKFTKYALKGINTQYKIVNPSVIPCIFGIIQYCHVDTQIFVLKFFDILTAGKSSLDYNINECTNCEPQVRTSGVGCVVCRMLYLEMWLYLLFYYCHIPYLAVH
jgi:hypothetical protein